MNVTEAARLAAAISLLRPEWPGRSLRTFLTDDKNHISKRPYQDAAVAMAYIATDPLTKTPARVLEAGPWWHIGTSEPEPLKHEQCPRCRDYYLPSDEVHVCSHQSRKREHHIAELKAAYRDATMGTCSHGVMPYLCKDHRRTVEDHPLPEEAVDA